MNAGKVTGRRDLQFESIHDVLQDIDRIVSAHRAGTLKALGNWTPGQILAHLAAWIEYGYEGYPVKAPPWMVRFILKRMLGRFLKRGIPRGVRIPGIPQGTVGQDDMPLEEAAKRLRGAFERLSNDKSCMYASPAFGPMSHEDRIRLNLRHAELHLGFLQL